jgi:ubiquinone/menaquinone biosynthesis C-methylase UbiE
MAQQLPFPSGAFNSVVSTFPAEFILHPSTLSEINRVLAPDGLFVLVPIALLTGGGLVGRALEWLYAVTRQRPAGETMLLPQFQAAGFQPEVEWVSLPRSRVMVIVSGKRSP